MESWEHKLKQMLEKEGIEIHTVDRLSIKDADAVIMFDNIFYKNMSYIWEMYKYRKLDKCIYIDYEPPTGHCRNHSKRGLRRLSNIFKYIITYNDDVVNNRNIIKGCIGNFYSKDYSYNHDFKNRKFVTMITNPTNIEQIIKMLNYYNFTIYYNEKNLKDHPKEIYGERVDAARYFLNKCPEEFDLYGVNWKKEFNKVYKGYLDKKEKCKILSKYKFIISYDSMIKQNGYISEKIFDAFRAKTVPIYWGADNIEEYIPKECYIDKRKFASYDDLYNYLRSITEEEYNTRINAIEKFLQSDKYKKNFSSEASANVIKKALLSERKKFSYMKAYINIKSLDNKKKKVDKYRKIQYFLKERNVEKNSINICFKFVHFFKEDKIKFLIKQNGIIYEPKNVNIEVEDDIELSQTYTFTYNIKNNKKKNVLEVFLIYNGKMQKLMTEDCTNIKEKQKILRQNRKKNKIYINF